MTAAQEQEHWRELLDLHRRALRVLELQAAHYGLAVPLEIMTQIEDRREQIADLEAKLAAAAVEVATVKETFPKAAEQSPKVQANLWKRLKGWWPLVIALAIIGAILTFAQAYDAITGTPFLSLIRKSTPTPTMTWRPTTTPTLSPTAMPVVLSTPTRTPTPTPTSLPVHTPTVLPTPTGTPTATPTSSPTHTPTVLLALSATPESSPTHTPTVVPSAIHTPTPISTPTPVSACGQAFLDLIRTANQAQIGYMKGELLADRLDDLWGDAAAGVREQADAIKGEAERFQGVITDAVFEIVDCRVINQPYENTFVVTTSEEWEYTARLQCPSGTRTDQRYATYPVEIYYLFMGMQERWRITSWLLGYEIKIDGWRCPDTLPTQSPMAKIAVGTLVRVSGTGQSGIRLRAGPGLSFATLAIVEEAARLEVLEGPVEEGGLAWWRLLEVEDSTVGWASANWLTTVE